MKEPIMPMSDNEAWLEKWVRNRTGSSYLFDHYKGVLQDLADAEIDMARVKIIKLKKVSRQAGIMEVASWLQQNCKYEIEAGINGRELATFPTEDWQFKFKDWMK